jgi:hypothetical protein
LDDEDFLNLQVAHRLGCFGAARPSLGQSARDFAMAVSSGGALAWNAAAKSPYEEKSAPPSEKAERALQSILQAGADFDLVIDMQDRRVRSLVTPEAEVFPTFVFNRPGPAPGRILWPHPGDLHAIGSPSFLGPFPDPAAKPFHERAARVVWRGAMTGRGGGWQDVRKEGSRFQKLMSEVESGRRNMAWAGRKLMEFPRFNFVSRLAANPRADVALVSQDWLHPLSGEVLGPVTRAPMPQREQAQNRYIAVVRGADLASSFFWTMNSGSLGLVMDTPWESFASVHFKAWVHYVPFKIDMSDFEERLDWCENHLPECAGMVEAAGKMCRILARGDLRGEADKRVIGALRDALRQDWHAVQGAE